MTTNQWGADVPISMPQPLPPEAQSLVPMGGFTMTLDGLFPDLTEAQHEVLSRPSFAPFNLAAPSVEADGAPEIDREWT